MTSNDIPIPNMFHPHGKNSSSYARSAGGRLPAWPALYFFLRTGKGMSGEGCAATATRAPAAWRVPAQSPSPDTPRDYTCMRKGKVKAMAPQGQLVRQLAQCQHSSPCMTSGRSASCQGRSSST